MKLTEHKRVWIDNKITHYCNLLKVDKPKVFLTMAEYDSWKVQERANLDNRFKRVGRSNCLGVCHREDKFIVILPKRISTLKALDHTIRHELLHYAKPSYNHYSADFEDRMNRLKLGKINEKGRFE